jgi:4-amino-4-deoxy-L-arabinose transferase-like glycosyltransferase
MGRANFIHASRGKLIDRLKQVKLETWLFLGAIAVYLLTRLVSLTQFPIYFFTDEAIQTMSANDLVVLGFRDEAGRLLPTYFENGSQYNLSFSVYLQLIPNLLFGRSVWVTRGTAVLATLIAAFSLGLILRDFFKVRHWWLGPLVLAIIPSWFLHSRTAFETSLMASLVAGSLYFYLRYRYKDPRNLYPALVLGALAFYSYSPGQVVVVVTSIALIISDFRYHWKQRRTMLIGLLLLVLLAAPYIRFRIEQGTEITHHLQILKSYLLGDMPLWEKLLNFVTRYLKGLNPLYWFLPNNVDLIRHIMKGMGHLPLITAPLLFLGLWQCIRNFRSSAHRLVLIALLAAPTGAALVDIAITRVLVLVIPAVVLISLGFEYALEYLSHPRIPKWFPGVVLFGLLTLMSFGMLVEALVNGPTWYADYTLYGLQYGGQELFNEIKDLQKENPEKKIILSPNWANGTDVIARFFLGDSLPVKIGSIQEFGNKVLPLDKNTIHIMLPNEYQWMIESRKFTDIDVIRTIKYPNGSDGFFFVIMNYVDNINEVIEQDIAERRKPRQATIVIDGQEVQAVYPLLDMNEIKHAFDNNDTTLIRTFEANPLRIELTFPEPQQISEVTALVGGASTRLTLVMTIPGRDYSVTWSTEVGESTQVRPITIELDEPVMVDHLVIEVLNINDGNIAHVHLWEIKFK